MGEQNDWRRVEELFFQCQALPVEEQRAFLARECGENLDLRQRVEQLLVADASVGTRLEGIVERAAAEEAVETNPSAPDLEQAGADQTLPGIPEQLGAYRRLEVLGEGGMGTVYLGERADGSYRQRVAIKVVKQGFLNPQASRRFERERQILARLEHPSVARLLDGGTTASGLPYLVMELVDGERIDEFCNHHRLSVVERLRLIQAVCAGVGAAHRNLVVHRDLKPSNILVTPEGQPKLLDFGISKLMEDDDPVHHTALTLLGQRLLTPEYASPEQVREEPITTAVDVYALGLILHRLLTGDRPYPLPTTSGESLRRAICEVPAEGPSTTVARLMAQDPGLATEIADARAIDPSGLRRQLAGDLDHIVLKALRKEAAERYGSVEDLAADIGRHLDGLPVEARRGGWRYRAGRVMRRNRSAVAAGTAIVLALAAGLWAQTREAERANREADRANREAERANLEARESAEVVDFLVRLFDASDPILTREPLTARQLLDRGVERIDEELADQPLLQAHLMSTLGRIYHNSGEFPEAEALFAGSLERRQQELSSQHPEVAAAHLDLADNLRVLGRVEEAMPHYETALALRREHFGSEGLETAEVLNNMALGWIRNADYDRANELLERALAIRQRELGDSYLVSQCLHNLTLIALRRGDYRAAVQRGRETLELKAEVLPPDHPSTARSMTMLASGLRELGDLAEAEQHLRRALEMMRNAWGEHHLDVLAVRGDLAFLRHLEGDREGAEIEQREVLAQKREHLGEGHREVAHSLDALGQQCESQGKWRQAEEALRQSLALRLELYDDPHPSLALGRHRLGVFLLRRGRLDEAESLLREALSARQQVLPPGHPAIGESQVELADFHLRRGSRREAEELARAGSAILDAALPADAPRVRRAASILAATTSLDHATSGDRATPSDP